MRKILALGIAALAVTAAAAHDLRGGYSQECGPNNNGTECKAGNGDVGELRGQERTHGRANGYTNAADYLRGEEQTQRSALDGDEIDVCSVRFSGDGSRGRGRYGHAHNLKRGRTSPWGPRSKRA